MIKISIVTPIRANIMEFERLMESLKSTTSDLSQIELVLVADECDEVFTPRIDYYKDKYKEFNIQFLVVERSTHFVRDYYNFASLQAKGRWILAINVDVMFMTKNWDNIICDKMERAARERGDDILYGMVKDGLPRSGNPEEEAEAKRINKALWHAKVDFSCWILTSKEFVTFFGGMMDDRNKLWGADHWTGLAWQIVQKGSRIVMIRDVFIDHISHHTKDMPQPESFEYFCQIMRDNPMVYDQKMAQEVATKITEHIKKIHS